MPEYDAFGREIGEDSLASLRQPGETPPRDHDEAALREARAAREARADEASDAANAFGMPEGKPRRDDATESDDGAPSAAASSGSAWKIEAGPGVKVSIGSPGGAAPKPVFVPPSRGHRRASRGGVVAVLVVAATVVVVAIGVLAVGIFSAGSAVVDQLNDLGPAETGTRPEPVGLGAGSLLRPAAFERAIATLREAGGRADNLRVAPARIDTQLTSGNRTRMVQIQPGGELREIATVSGGGSTRAPLAWGRIDPHAPERLTRAAARRLKISPRRIDYLVLGADPAQWGAYFKNGRIVIGDRRGRVTRILPG